MSIEKLTKRLHSSIDFALDNEEGLDAASWDYQEGILITVNEAKLLLEIVKRHSIPDAIHRFSVNDKVKTIVGKRDKLYHQKRKGSHAVVLHTHFSLNKPCYWLKFTDGHEEWYNEDELNVV